MSGRLVQLRGPRPAWFWEGLLLAAVVALILGLGGSAVRASYHGFLHTALGEAVWRDGLAPENPYHAGAPLRYYTLYPALGVALGKLGCGPLWAFALLNVLAAFLFAPALDALGRALDLSATARRCAFVLAVLGFNALGWLGFLLPHLGELGERPVFALRPMTFADHGFGWDPRLQAFLPKFLNVSSFALALPFAFWAMAEAARAAAGERERLRTPPRPLHAAGHAAAALAVNPLVGGFAGLVMALWAFPELRRRGLERWRWPLAGALALLLAYPFVMAALQPAESGPALIQEAFRGHPLANFLGPLLLLVPLGILGLRRLPPPARWRWIAAAAAAAIVVFLGEMPWGNEYKMARFGGVLWALPAGACLAAWWEQSRRTRWAAGALLALGLPGAVLVPWAYLAWAAQAEPLPLRGIGARLEVAPDGPLATTPASLLAAEAAADPEAVLLLNPFRKEAAADRDTIQGEPLAALLHHSLFVDSPQIHNDRIPDLAARLSLCQDFFGRPAQPLEKAHEALRRIRDTLPQRPFLVLSPERPPRSDEALAAAGAQVLARADGFTLWQLPAAASGRSGN